mgnify:FL=1
MSFHWNDKEPIYLQLKDMVRDMILAGELPEGEALPSVRQVAMDYKLNPLTVSKSWQLLVDEGLVEKRRGLGMFVQTGAKAQLKTAEQSLFLDEVWPNILQKIKHLNMNTQELIQSLEHIGREK